MHFKRTNFNIAFTGIMLSLTLLFQYLEQFFPIVKGLMSLNFSLIFLLVTYVVTNYFYGTLILFLRFFLTPFLIPSSFGLAIGFFGSFVGLVSASIFIHIILVFKNMKILNIKKPIIPTLVIASITSTFLMILLNGFVFIPLWSYLVGWGWKMELSVWGINIYWGAVISLYFVGNLTNYTIASIGFYQIRKSVKTLIIFE